MSLRTVFQDLFKGSDFTKLQADVTKIAGDLLIITTAVIGMEQALAALDMTSLNAKLDLANMGEGSLLFPDMKGVVGDFINVPVLFSGDTLLQVEAFGFGGGGNPGFVFDETQLAYRGVVKGDLILDWVSFDGNEVNPGDITIGGYQGSGTAIDGGRKGVLFYVQMEILVDTFTESQFRLENFVDDVSTFKPQPVYGRILYGQ
jgi:hypothetical protein